MVKIIAEGSGGRYTLPQLLQIMEALRSPGGCPWDREQTHQSIKNDALEEVYEVVDAIDNNDTAALCEELGDMLLQVVFHSQIAREENEFSFDEVVDGICKKLVLRHPHVFGSESVENSAEVLDLWDSIKKEEKNQTTVTDTLESVPKAFPALMRAAKVQKRAKKAGVATAPDIAKVKNALAVFEENLNGQKQELKAAYGNLLFLLAGMAQGIDINAEEALNFATNAFIEDVKKAEN
ncbi:MAG: nucleoside triphosphate pyrophosphohydrolase [Clostridia bacterium]|nr:nucleoside triphosphate pyrophosphohydrolase [Clostridia bacterium]